MKKVHIKWSTPKRDLKVKDISKTKQQILKDINKEIKNAIKHFNAVDGGWKLNKDYIQSQILLNIVDFCIEDEINQAFINAGLVIEYNEGGSFVRTKEEYHPIYMNQRTGKLYIVKNSDDKSYIYKFRECNGYVFIGKL